MSRLFKSYRAPWCVNDMVVDAGRTREAKPITLIYPYYENPQFLKRQFDHWLVCATGGLTKPNPTSGKISVIVVDDGSPTNPASEVLGSRIEINNWLRVFRIGVDIRWNWLAARNIGAHHAETEWILLTDMDHVVSHTLLESLVYGKHDPSVVYGFSRLDLKEGQELLAEITPHPNSWFMTKAKFWEIGGYDESFSGHYGTDGEWRKRIRTKADIHILSDYLVRHEYHGDSSTTHYKRKQPVDREVSRIIKARKPGWKPKVLSFPYTEVKV